MYKLMGLSDKHHRVFKELADVVAVPLCIKLEESLLSGKVPGDRKKGRIITVFKKGSKEELGNYKPMSLTCAPDKVVEHILLCYVKAHKRQGGHLRQPARLHHGRIMPNQSGGLLL